MKRLYATRRTRALRTIAIYSRYVWSLGALKPKEVILYLRVSSRSQKDRKNLKFQKSTMLAALEKLGIRVIAIFEETASGDADHRSGFGRAILKAIETGAPIVAESVDRFRRCFTFEERRKPLPLNLFEMGSLMAETDGVLLATLIHPDASEKEVHRQQTKRGQQGRGKLGGRPKKDVSKKTRREENLPLAVELWKAGWSYRQIGKKLEVPYTTIRDWIQRSRKSHTRQS